MQTLPTLAQQRPALGALAQMAGAFAHLPGAHLDISPTYPDQLTISVHDDLGAFEVWREALGITPDAVSYKALTSHMHIKAEGTFAGAAVELVGYAPALPVPDGGERP